MNPAIATLLALAAAIILSIVSRMNVGLVAIGLAWVVGVYVADVDLVTVVGGFPASLFLTLTGVTLLFAAAEANGTLERLAHRGVGLVGGQVRLIPWMFFAIACLVSTVGPGAISSVALVVPLAMVIGKRVQIPPFLTALMVANGANAGNLSPVSSVGVIVNGSMAGVGMGGHEGKVWFTNFVAHLLVAIAAFLLFGGRRLSGQVATPVVGTESLTTRQRATVGVIGLWIVGVLVFKLSLGLSAFMAVAVLIGFRATDEAATIRRTPWGVIIMVSGVTLLVALLEVTGGMDLFSSLLSRLATPGSINGVIAFVTGTISTYSSTSGVVLPTFLPTVPALVRELGGGDPLAVALSINVGSSLVDVSPLSTLGALCVAALPGEDAGGASLLFRRLLIWGLVMSLVGAIIAQVLAGPLARF